MPTLVLEQDVRLERSDLSRRVALPRDINEYGMISPPVRASGLHLSGLLKYIAQTSKISARLEEIADEEYPLRWALGQAWEEYAISLHPEMIWQPGEITQPLIMNCDGVANDDHDHLVVHEFKFNRAKKWSGQDLIQKKWLWMQQGLGYCLGYQTDTVHWHVLSAMQWPDPIYTVYQVRFSQAELDSSMRMIKANREAAIRDGYAE